jgi:hypothetical protein
MSHSTKYITQFDSGLGTTGIIYYQKRDYDGSIVYLNEYEGNSLEVSYQMEDEYDPIIGTTMSIGYLNDATDFYRYSDLFSPEEKEFRVIVDVSNNTESIRLFDGYLDSGIFNNQYTPYEFFSLSASNDLHKINHRTPTLIETPEKQSLIYIINSCLQLAGKDTSILTNCSLYPTSPAVGTPSSSTNIFNLTGINTEVFWKDNTERFKGLDILTTILKTLDCKLYWFNNKYYIQRIGDIWVNDGSKGFVEYNINTPYYYRTPGTARTIHEVSTNIALQHFVGDRKSFNSLPAVGVFKMNLDMKPYLNLTVNDFSDIKTSDLPLGSYDMNGTARNWTKYSNVAYGFTDFAIVNGVSTPGYRKFKGFKSISNGVFRYSAPRIFPLYYLDKASVYTRFKTTVDVTKNSGLNIKWKWLPIDIGGNFTFKDSDYTFRWYLRVSNSTWHIIYDEEAGEWKKISSATPATFLNNIEVKGSDLNKVTGLYEANIDIDLSGEYIDLDGDVDFVFGIAVETCTVDNDWWSEVHTPLYVAYGDVIISSTGTPQHDIIKAVVNNDSFEEKEVTLDVYDIEDLNNRNGFYTDVSFGKRTIKWKDATSSEEYPLTEWFAANKFQLYKKNRQAITGRILRDDFLRPLSMWYNTADPSNLRYLLTSHTIYPLTHMYDVYWSEYDDSETFNIFEEEEFVPEPTGYLGVSPKTLNFTYSEQNDTVNITTDLATTWSASSDQEWCDPEQTTGGPSGTCTIAVSQNPGPAYRRAYVTFISDQNPAVFDVCQITQQPPF